MNLYIFSAAIATLNVIRTNLKLICVKRGMEQRRLVGQFGGQSMLR
jgi:hypothetical protein